jgi:hypothetical protein
MTKLKTMPLTVWAVPLLFFLSASGDDGEGNEDTLLTGFTGLVILCLVVYGIYRLVKSRGGGE